MQYDCSTTTAILRSPKVVDFSTIAVLMQPRNHVNNECMENISERKAFCANVYRCVVAYKIERKTLAKQFCERLCFAQWRGPNGLCNVSSALFYRSTCYCDSGCNSINQSINQSKRICIAPCVANESEAQKLLNRFNFLRLYTAYLPLRNLMGRL